MISTTLSLGSLTMLLLNLHDTLAVESNFASLNRHYYRGEASKVDRRLLQTDTSSVLIDENSNREDYTSENLWVGQSDFEGLFEHENEIGDKNFVASDYEENFSVSHVELKQEDNDLGVSVHNREDNTEQRLDHVEIALNHDKIATESDDTFHTKYEAPDDSDGGMMNRMEEDIDSGITARGVNLPSFEETPMPKKISFSQWMRKDVQKRIRNIGHTEELTSSMYLVPQAKALREKSYVASCLVVRDDQNSILEWINHHLSLGIRRIYVYDHLSFPPLESILSSFIGEGLVVYERLTIQRSINGLSPQLYAYNKCLQDHGNKHKWLTFLDVDEFIMFRDGHPIQSLPAFLTGYEPFSSLAIHWILFGSSEHDAKPTKSVLRSYTKCVPLRHSQHLFVKSIVNTKCTEAAADSPHSFKHNCSAPAVRTDMSPIVGASGDNLPVHDKLAIYHYAIKSVEDFELKILKGSGMRRQRGWDYFFFVDGWSIEFNFDGLRVWNTDVVSKSRALDPETLNLQIEGYSKEILEDFWGNSQAQKEDVLDYSEQYDEYKFQTQEEIEKIDDDDEEGGW